MPRSIQMWSSQPSLYGIALSCQTSLSGTYLARIYADMAIQGGRMVEFITRGLLLSQL